MNYTKYTQILEYIPHEVCNESLLIENLSIEIINFIKVNEITNVLISLSGGVDSMVLTYIMKYIDINFYCCHINYNNRNESVEERDFLIDWCNYHKINLDIYNIDHIKRGDINRNDYEEETRKIRYDYYKKLIKKFNCSGVMLGHHKDDLSENIFNNIMRGRKEITDLSVFKKKNILMDVIVFRPMLDFNKNDIYDISDKYQIPYFLDTTPDWSCRGKMRRKIFPECESCYSNSFMNSLIKLGSESDEMGNIFSKYIIDPLIQSVKCGKYGFIIPKSDILQENLIFKKVIRIIFNKNNIRNIKTKSLDNLYKNYNNLIQINVIKDYFTFIDTENIIFINEMLINDFVHFNKKLIENSKSNPNELINGKIYFKWKKKKYVPDYEFNFLNNKFRSINFNNIGDNILFYK
jgi:tRNA(Ile)-lysidine synthetase-like protein